MNTVLYDMETVRFVFVLGVVLSIWLYDRFHIASGSVIAPAYLALNLCRPVPLLIIAGNTLIAYLLVHVLLPRFVMMRGRDKFHALIPVSILLQTLAHAWAGTYSCQAHSDLLLIGVGYVIPGLLAHNLSNQGLRNTLIGVGGLAIGLGLAALLVSGLMSAGFPAGPAASHETLSFDVYWLPFAMLLSAVSSIALVYRWEARSGGFVGAAYVSLFVSQPLQLVQIALLSLGTYLIVVRLLAPRMILFGRRKFALMLLVASMLTWGVLLLRESLSGAGNLSSTGSFALIHLTLTGLFANDLDRVGIRRLAGGTLLAVAFTLSTTLWVTEALGVARLEIVLPLLAASLVSAGLLFGAPLRTAAGKISGTERDPEASSLEGTCPASTGGGLTPLFHSVPVRCVLIPACATVIALLIGFSPVWREAPLVLHEIQTPATGLYAPRVVAHHRESSPDGGFAEIERATRQLNGRQPPPSVQVLARMGQRENAILDGEQQ
jgi:poly-gamma-glutamate biosynthesis protein PgsC/CapC